MSQHQYPEDFAFRRRPGLAARVDTIRAPIMWAELGIISQALNGTPAEGRTLPSGPPGHCPETASPITECECRSRMAAPDPPICASAESALSDR